MKVLIVTQSSESGLNRKVANRCEDLVRRLDKDEMETKIRNADEIDYVDIEDYRCQIWIVPEWNGSFPHTFKRLIDGSGYPSAFEGHEILLIGTSESTFGNLIGITHLEHILQWCGAHVFDKRICLPFLHDTVDSGKLYTDDRLEGTIARFIC
jgi:hypothetical protein